MTVFADTFYFLALLIESDPAHEEALAWSDASAGIQLLTTAWVMTEVADAMCRRDNRHLAVELIRGAGQRDDVTIIPPDPDLFEAALSLYEARPDKDWSLTDCVSFVVMRREGVTDALTGDRHFTQAGFRALFE